MAQNLTTTSTPSRPILLSTASDEYVDAVLNGRCNQERLVDALRTLLGLYFVPNETAEERARQIALFVSDLSEFSDDAVWWALREWRRTQDRRPTPAGLRQLCMVRRQEAIRRQGKPQVAAPRDAPTEAEKARIRKLLDDAGYSRRNIINSAPEPI